MNKIEINIPEGFEIDNEKSNFSKGIIEFKPVDKKELNYNYIAKNLFINKLVYYTEHNGTINYIDYGAEFQCKYPNNSTSKEQLECLMAYNKLRNVAEYLNKGYKFNYLSEHIYNYYIFNNRNFGLQIGAETWLQNSSVYFASKELAKEAISILGEEEIKKALFIY